MKSIKSDLDEIDEVLKKPSSPMQEKPKPPSLGQMIKSVFDHLVLNVEVLKQVRDTLASVATESGRLYNRFDDYESHREKDLKRRVDELSCENGQLKREIDFVVKANSYIRGRMETLQQIAKVEPLRPEGDMTPPPSPSRYSMGPNF